MSERPALTVGMACYDDFEGVWFTVSALRLYHAAVMSRVEMLVVDNHPASGEGRLVREFLEAWVPEARYLPYDTVVGTAAPRNQVFREARGDAVLCLDSHVLLAPGAVQRLIAYYESHPDCRDLLQGPLVYDDLRTYSSHFRDEWRAEMWGVWATDERALDLRKEQPNGEWIGTSNEMQRTVHVPTRDQPPFEIPAQGLGVFSCRRDAWLEFHPHFRGFGGEEFYIHEKFRQAGRRTLCLPFLRWVHRFSRPRGVPYPLTAAHKFRNYVLGLSELGLPLQPAIDHFKTRLSAETLAAILADPAREVELRDNDVSAAAAISGGWRDKLRHSLLQLLRPPIRTLPRQPAAAESLGVKDRSVPSPPATRDDPQESPIAINGRKGRAGKAAVRQPRACGHDKFPSLGREPVQLGWYEWIARRHPGGRFVDVGAGVGAGLAYLTYLGARSVQGFDVDPRLRDYPRIAIGRSALEALGPRCCDVAVCIDVIEHVVEDGPFFQELRQLAMRALYVTTPNYNRSRAASAFHAREYTIAEFVNRFQPDELWVASPDGWYHRTQLLIRESDCYRRCSTGDIWPVGHVPTDFYFHDNSPDGLEWAHFCGVFQTECVAS